MFPGETILSGAPIYNETSGFKVMRSAAGWYIGTGYADPDMGGAEVPNSRESVYYATAEDAEGALNMWKKAADSFGDFHTAYRMGLLDGARR